MSKVAAIHQPNFFPWLGYFDKIQQVDEFIFFDHVQRPRGKNWVQRVQVIVGEEARWLTIPIRKSNHSIEMLHEAEIMDPKSSYTELLEKLSNWYRKASHFKETLPLLEELMPADGNLSRFNGQVISFLSEKMGLGTTFSFSSSKPELVDSSSVETDMIIETCKAFGVSHYLSGSGCLDFLVQDQFAENDIQLAIQYYEHPDYTQHQGKPFVKGLSVIDSLMNIGVDGTAELLNSSPHKAFDK